MRYIKLNDVERKTLCEGFKKHKKHHMRVRFKALLLSDAGRQVKDIALFSVTRTRSIYTWMDNWETYGVAGLMIKKGRGVKPKLDLEEKELVELVKKSEVFSA